MSEIDNPEVSSSEIVSETSLNPEAIGVASDAKASERQSLVMAIVLVVVMMVVLIILLATGVLGSTSRKAAREKYMGQSEIQRPKQGAKFMRDAQSAIETAQQMSQQRATNFVTKYGELEEKLVAAAQKSEEAYDASRGEEALREARQAKAIVAKMKQEVEDFKRFMKMGKSHDFNEELFVKIEELTSLQERRASALEQLAIMGGDDGVEAYGKICEQIGAKLEEIKTIKK